MLWAKEGHKGAFAGLPGPALRTERAEDVVKALA
jgi:hypothetical protein